MTDDLVKARSRRYREKNHDKILEKRRENYQYHKEYHKKWLKDRPEQLLLQHARARARKQGLPFSIIRSDIVIPEFCPLLGIPLTPGDVVHTPHSPTLDKIIPELGYVPSNIWVISFKANTIKNNATLEEFELILENWKKHLNGR